MRIKTKYFWLAMIIGLSGCKNDIALPEKFGLKNSNKTSEESCSVTTRFDQLKKNNEDTLNRYLNLAGFAYQEQNYQLSNQYFDQAIDKYRFFENKGVISASRTLGYITASFLDDTFLDYEGDGYEKVMMHNYKAINYLMLNDKEAARVEIRNSYKKQMEEKQKFDDEIAEYKKEVNEQVETEKKLPRKKQRYRRSRESIYNKLEPLFKGVNAEHMPYQNPFAYYISALVYEENGEYDEAYIDMKKALSFYPDSDIIKQKLLYYARKGYGKSSQEYEVAAKSSSDDLSDQRAEVFINISVSPIKEQMKVPIYLGGAMQFTSFPTFKLSESDIDHIVIKDQSGKVVAQSSILTDVDAIVVNLFKDRLPGIIIRQVINVGSRTVASESISNQVDHGNALVSATVGLGLSMFNALTTKADTRTWSTLPSRIHALSFNLDPNQNYTVHVINKSGKEVDKGSLVLNKKKDLKNSYAIITIKGNDLCQ
ncbi:MAG: hypothetical protein IE880_00250 [Epsilonproteobacteria bacterium]|nr:hypothetical protein [Campylobacterota bacterium]